MKHKKPTTDLRTSRIGMEVEEGCDAGRVNMRRLSFSAFDLAEEDLL